MAFYLDEAFRRSPEVRVLHNLGFVGDAGIRHQIDHLVIHRRTICIVESKSVSTEVTVNQRDEWSRLWDGKLQGMPSPVEQAKRQADALRRFVNDRSTSLAKSGKANKFEKLPIAIFVAISDNGRWTQESIETTRAHPVFKADLVAGKIREEIKRHEKAAKFFSSPDGDYGTFTFADDSFERVAALLRSHANLSPSGGRLTENREVEPKPVNPVTVVKSKRELLSATSQPSSTEIFACKKCQASVGTAKPGRFGAFVLCGVCGENNGVGKKCASCSGEARSAVVDGSLRVTCKSCSHTSVILVPSLT